MVNVAFGTDGIRGRSGEFPIVPEVAHAVGRAAVKLARRFGGESVLIGRDGRPSGVELARAVGQGVIDAGGSARDAGVVPTSAVQVGVADGLAAVGVMVTASHNPESDNGFKVIGPGGRKLDDPTAADVEVWLTDPPPTTAGFGAPEDLADRVRRGWRARFVACAGDLSALRGRRIVIDLANGASNAVRDLVTELVPAEIVWIGTDGVVNDGVGTEHLAHLQTKVAGVGCVGGFAVDGDGDRCRLVDQNGVEISGDAVTWRLALDAQVEALAVTVMSSGSLEKLLPGVRVVRTPVGDRFLRQVMDQQDLPLGAEESGHVLFGEHPGGDGLLTGVRALLAAFRSAPTLADAFGGFVPMPRKTTRVVARAQPPLDDLVAVQRARAAGLERLGPHGKVFLRYSGTEPVLRILVEGEPQAAVDAVSAAVTSAASKALS
ncbi:MAG: hypothetical protein ABMA64_21040 [Myxococcota bacterium]